MPGKVAQKNTCRKGGRTEKVLEADGFFNFGENVMRVSHSSSHAAVKWRCVLKSIYMSEGKMRSGGEADSSLLPWQHSTIGAATNTLAHDGHIWWCLPVRMACSGALTDARSSLEPWVTRSPAIFTSENVPPQGCFFSLTSSKCSQSSTDCCASRCFHTLKPSSACTRLEETKSHHLISCLTNAVCPLLTVNILFLVTLLCVFLPPSKAPCVQSSIKGN